MKKLPLNDCLLNESGPASLVAEHSTMGNRLNNILIQGNRIFITENGPLILVVQFNLLPI